MTWIMSINHAANDMQLIPIEKVHSKRDSVRKAREMSIEFLDCLKRERAIRIKPKLRGGKTAFR